MFWKKSPARQYISADKKIQKLRNKRSKLDEKSPDYQQQVNAINGKIHDQNVVKRVSELQLQHPKVDASKRSTNVSVNVSKKVSKKSYEAHAHYHAAPKSKKK